MLFGPKFISCGQKEVANGAGFYSTESFCGFLSKQHAIFIIIRIRNNFFKQATKKSRNQSLLTSLVFVQLFIFILISAEDFWLLKIFIYSTLTNKT